MQLVVEATRVTDRLAIVISPPQRCVGSATVGASHADATIPVRWLRITHTC